MDRVTAKLLSLALIFFIIAICTLLPIWVSRWVVKKGEKGLLVISVLTCFGGGVFLGAYLMLLHPDARAILEDAWLTPSDITYPLSELVIGVGFFLVLFIEYAIIWYNGKRLHSKFPVGHSQVVKSTLSNDQFDDNVISTDRTNGITVTHFKKGIDNMAVELGDEKLTNGGATQTGFNSAEENGDVLPTGGGGAQPGSSPTSDIKEAAAQGRSIVLIVALSLDCIFEGMAVGLQMTKTGVWSLFVAIISHEFIMGFCLGLELVKYYSTKGVVIGAVFYALTVPAGITIGMLVLETQSQVSTAVDITNGVLMSISAGCFLYVAFFGILTEEIRKKSTMPKLVAVILGFLLMAGMALIPTHEEEDQSLTTVNYTTITTEYVF